jgi:hypothetical protein
MQIVQITTSLPKDNYEELARRAAVDQGFNCYSKSVANPDVSDDTSSTFYYKWKGRTLKVVINKKDEPSKSDTV